MPSINGYQDDFYDRNFNRKQNGTHRALATVNTVQEKPWYQRFITKVKGWRHNFWNKDSTPGEEASYPANNHRFQPESSGIHNHRQSQIISKRSNQPHEGQTPEEVDFHFGAPSSFSTPTKRKADDMHEQMTTKKLKRIDKQQDPLTTEAQIMCHRAQNQFQYQAKEEYSKLLQQHISPEASDPRSSRYDRSTQHPGVERKKLSQSEVRDLIKRFEKRSIISETKPINTWLTSRGKNQVKPLERIDEKTVLKTASPKPWKSSPQVQEDEVNKLVEDLAAIEIPASVREFKEHFNRTLPVDKWLEELKNNEKKINEKRKQQIESKEKDVKHLFGKRSEFYNLFDNIRRKTDTKSQLTWSVPWTYRVEPEPEEEEEEIEALDDLIELTDKEHIVIDEALRQHLNDEEVLVDKFNITIKRKDIQTLQGLNWLNDEIINFYFNLITEKRTNVYAFNTFFYPKLVTGKQKSLARWTRKVDLFKYDKILIPIHLGMHWTLAVIDMKVKRISYYDSMGANNRECLLSLYEYLQDEHMDKKKSPLQDTFELVKEEGIPKQFNGSDCGMFACKYAEFISRNAKFTFDQTNMSYYRRRMIYEIISKRLLNEEYS